MGIAGSPLKDRVIFVEGAPRSGTTWLQTLLATHPDIAGVEAESHLFDFGVDQLFDNIEGRHPYLHGLRSYLDRDELVDLARDLCDGVLLAMRAHVSVGSTPPFVVEKTPIGGKAGGLDLVRKRDCYPDAWYVHIVRDREAVARSLMRAPWMADRSHKAGAALWNRTVGDARATLGDLPRYSEVSYEELRADPEAGLRALFEWLGVAAGEDVMETARAISREQVSDLGAVPPAGTGSRRAALAATPRRLA
ncbi:MAG: sulfotransferase family protein, partial [Thermoleophilaceae bacterium]